MSGRRPFPRPWRPLGLLSLVLSLMIALAVAYDIWRIAEEAGDAGKTARYFFGGWMPVAMASWAGLSVTFGLLGLHWLRRARVSGRGDA